MKPREKLKELMDGRGRPVWLYLSEVQAVKHIPTRYGPRLLLHMRESGAEVWIEDTEKARKMLKLDQAEAA